MATTANPPVNSDDEEIPPDKSNNLNWRANPSETLSDWKIKVSIAADVPIKVGNFVENTITNETPVHTYHVHKCILAYGWRQSRYFSRLFHSADQYAEATDFTSRIELKPLAADAFPQLLDFMYSTDGKLDINTQNATALYSLGQYFEIPQLRREAKQFWKNDMNLDNVDTYYEHAKIFHVDKLLHAVTEMCALRLMDISPSSKILEVSDPQLWIEVIESKGSVSPCASVHDRSHHLSRLMAEYCARKELDTETFQRLTCQKELPHLHFDAASKLSDLEDKIFDVKDDDVEEVLTNLQERCVESMVPKWASLTEESMTEFLKRKTPLFLATILVKSLDEAKTEIEKAKDDIEEAKSKCRTLEHKIQSSNSTIAHLQRTESSLQHKLEITQENLKSFYEKKLDKMRLELEDARRQLKYFKPLQYGSGNLYNRVPTAVPHGSDLNPHVEHNCFNEVRLNRNWPIFYFKNE